MISLVIAGATLSAWASGRQYRWIVFSTPQAVFPSAFGDCLEEDSASVSQSDDTAGETSQEVEEFSFTIVSTPDKTGGGRSASPH